MTGDGLRKSIPLRALSQRLVVIARFRGNEQRVARFTTRCSLLERAPLAYRQITGRLLFCAVQLTGRVSAANLKEAGLSDKVMIGVSVC